MVAFIKLLSVQNFIFYLKGKMIETSLNLKIVDK